MPAAAWQPVLRKTRFRLISNAADAKLENTSLSTGVFKQSLLMNRLPCDG